MNLEDRKFKFDQDLDSSYASQLHWTREGEARSNDDERRAKDEKTIFGLDTYQWQPNKNVKQTFYCELCKVTPRIPVPLEVILTFNNHNGLIATTNSKNVCHRKNSKSSFLSDDNHSQYNLTHRVTCKYTQKCFKRKCLHVNIQKMLKQYVFS